MNQAVLEVTHLASVATVWLNRPAQRNALDPALIAALTQTLTDLAVDSTVRAVILAGRGTAFCAGADLGWMQHTGQASVAANQAEAERLATLLHILSDMPQPTLARVHGAAFAGGLGLVSACDLAIAAESASFGLPEVRIGLIPAVVSPYLLRAMSPRTCAHWALSGAVFDAAQAAQAGLVHEVVADVLLDEAVATYVAQLLKGGPHALAATKQLLREVAGQPWGPALRHTTATRIAQIRASAEAQAGLTAVRAGHAPPWQASPHHDA